MEVKRDFGRISVRDEEVGIELKQAGLRKTHTELHIRFLTGSEGLTIHDGEIDLYVETQRLSDLPAMLKIYLQEVGDGES